MADHKSNRVRGKLQLSNSKLNTILEITRAINENESQDVLLGFLEGILLKDLNIERFAFFTYEDNWKLSLSEGIDTSKIADINLYNIINKYQNIDVIHDSAHIGSTDFDIVVPVYHHNQPLAYLLLADIEEEKLEMSPIIKHLRFIQTIANIIVVALENKRLIKEEIKQIAIKKELETAQNMQSLLFPKKLPNDETLKVDAFYLPHSEVGGDYYDVISLSEHKTALVVADVSGKGMSAAILMANFQAQLRALIETTEDMNELIKKLNQKVIDSAKFEKFITVFAAIFDASNNTLEYVNSGHQPALLLTKDKIDELRTGSTILGMFNELPKLEVGRCQIQAGDKIICYTDGLSELEDMNAVQLEVDGLKKLIEHDFNLEEIQESIENKIDELAGYSGLNDDVTYLLAEFLPR